MRSQPQHTCASSCHLGRAGSYSSVRPWCQCRPARQPLPAPSGHGCPTRVNGALPGEPTAALKGWRVFTRQRTVSLNGLQPTAALGQAPRSMPEPSAAAAPRLPSRPGGPGATVPPGEGPRSRGHGHLHCMGQGQWAWPAPRGHQGAQCVRMRFAPRCWAGASAPGFPVGHPRSSNIPVSKLATPGPVCVKTKMEASKKREVPSGALRRLRRKLPSRPVVCDRAHQDSELLA